MKQYYDFLVIGGGPGGKPTAMALASAGKQVLLIDKGLRLGGTCLLENSIASMILRESARRLREIREAMDFGLCLPTQDIHIDWYAIQQRKRAILQQRSAVAMQRLQQFPTLNLIIGAASFLNGKQAAVTSHTGKTQIIGFGKAIIASDSTLSRPPIRGINHLRVLDSDSILEIDHIPNKLVIIGAGPIGVELGQIFNTFGSEVILLEAGSHILDAVDQELAKRLKQQMINEGINITTGCQIDRISTTGGGVFVEYQDSVGESLHHLTDTVLLVTDRHLNIEGLGLENTQILHTPHGIEVNTQLQTGEANIYAVGGVIGQPMFAHWSTAQGLALAHNLLGQAVPFPDKNTNSVMIFSEPQIGMVGLSEEQAIAAGIDFNVVRYDFTQNACAQIRGKNTGLLKILYKRKSHRVIGVHALVRGADNLMGEAALAVKAGLTLEALEEVIHAQPTLSESLGIAARTALATQ